MVSLSAAPPEFVSRADFNSAIAGIRDDFAKSITALTSSLSNSNQSSSNIISSQLQSIYKMIADTNRINNLSSVTISSPTITGSPSIENYVSTSGGSVTGDFSSGGNLTVSGTGTSTFAGGATFATSAGNVGIGTTTPNQQLEITQNFRMPNTTYAAKYGIIYKGADTFIHDFNYGNNGTVTTLGGNIFVGVGAGNLTMGSTATTIWDASYNIGVGYQALSSNTIGYQNSALGLYALQSNTTGHTNSALGAYALYSNTTGNTNSALGAHALFSNTTGHENSALGKQALFYNTTGYWNSALGVQALNFNTTGYYNSAVGAYALYRNTTGYNNSALGYYALYNLKPTSGAITAFADYSGTVPGTVKATSAGHGLTGTSVKQISGTVNYNGSKSITVIDADNFYFTATWAGTETGWWAVDTEGRYNVAIGANAGRSIVTGDSNTFLGNDAGYNASQLTSASNSMALGYGAYTTASNQVVIGNTSIAQTLLRGSVGIGTTTPYAKLSVTGTAIASTTLAIRPVASQTANILDVYNTSGTLTDVITSANRWGLGSTSPVAKLSVNLPSTGMGMYLAGYANGSGSLFSISTSTLTATSTAFIIDSNGKVGIGTSTPWQTLSVQGAMAFAGLTSTGGTQTLCLDANNQVVTNQGACTASSILVKHDIAELTVSGLDIINALKPSVFTYNNEDHQRYGFIAQDLAGVDKHFINYFDQNGNPITIDTTAILAAAVKAIQELAIKVENLIVNGSANLKEIVIDLVTAKKVQTKELCIDDVCVTRDQFKAVFGGGASQTSGSGKSDLSNNDTSSSSPKSDLGNPTITLLGNNPAEVIIGSTYIDLGAAAVDGSGASLMPDMVSNNVDTSKAGEYQVVWSAHDSAMNYATTTRTVVVTNNSQPTTNNEQATTTNNEEATPPDVNQATSTPSI
jgi:hypothetical protein